MHLLSLDIATGACLLSRAFTRLIPIKIPWYAYVLLFISALLVYWTDHLLDAKNEKITANSIRHRFFRENETLFFILIILLFIINVFIAFAYLDFVRLVVGIIALALAALYIFKHKQFPRILLFEKEFLTALIYGFAIGLLPIISLGTYAFFVWPEILLISTLITLSTIHNTFSIAKIECLADLSTSTRNLATRYSSSTLTELQVMFFILQICLSIVLILIAPLSGAYIVGGILLGNSILQFFLPNYAAWVEDESYRYLGEGLFIVCGLLCFIL